MIKSELLNNIIMASLKIKPKAIITCFQNIAPLFKTNLKHNLKLTNNLIFTNKFNHTLREYQSQIQEIKILKNCQWMNNFEPALQYLRSQNCQQNKNKNNPLITILIGQPQLALYNQLKNLQILTLEQMCALYPQKVPLSYRDRQNKQLKSKIQQRLQNKISLAKQPHISSMYYTGQNIKMWDQAIQVILDHQPCKNIIQFQHAPHTSTHYKLTMDDFIKATIRSYQAVFDVKHSKQLPQMVNFNINNLQIQWIIQHKIRSTCQEQFSAIIVDQDLVNDKDQLIRKYKNLQIQRVDENSSLWM